VFTCPEFMKLTAYCLLFTAYCMNALVEYFRSNLTGALGLLRTIVEIESCSYDKSGIDALAEFLAPQFRERGAVAEILCEPSGGNALRAVYESNRAGKPVMILGHLDTVWPSGSTSARPFRIEEGRAYGPGIFDMKSGIILSLLVCQVLREKKIDPGKNLIFFFSADEEIGSRTALPHLTSIARSCGSVLCLEPSLPGGKVKTFRKGVGSFSIRVEGIPSHAGVDHEKGANAILELSRLVVRLQSLTDYARGITVNVGKIQGGTASNVVPALCEAEVDFRVATVTDARWLENVVRSLEPADQRCRIHIEGGLERPPLERTPAVIELYEKARALAASVGMDLGEGSTGGGSDGSFTAGMGIPTLDGLGVQGEGAHALHEHIIVDDIPRRAALLTLLVQSL
jgi:glutamate carboxypeptidase